MLNEVWLAVTPVEVEAKTSHEARGEPMTLLLAVSTIETLATPV